MMSTLLGSVSMMALIAATPAVEELFLELADMTGWNNTNIGVDGNALISNSSSNPTGAFYPYEVGVGESALITAEIAVPIGASGWALFGINVNPSGATPVANSPYSAFVGVNGTTTNVYVGNSVGGSKVNITESVNVAGLSLSITIAITPDTVSLIARNPTTQFENLVVLDRGTLANGGVIKGFGVFMNGNQGASGSKIGKIRARKAVGHFSTDLQHSQDYKVGAGLVMHDRQSDQFRLIMPHGKGTTANPATLIVYSHAANHSEFYSYFDAEQFSVQEALVNAGYAIAAAYGGGNNWSNPASIQDFRDLLTWVDNHWNIDEIVIWGVSMGASIALNLAQMGHYGARLKGVYCVAGVCDLETMYASWTSSMNSAWGVSDLTGLQTAYAGSNPYDEAVADFEAGCANYRFIHQATDGTVEPTTNSKAMQTKLAAGTFTENSILEITGTGHLTYGVFDSTDFLSFLTRTTTV